MTCDEALYRQYLSGDDAGLEALMKKYGDPLTLYIDGYLHDVHEAEELMLDVFAYLFTKKPRIRDGGFKAYLYKAARHMALRHKSKRKTLFSLDALTGEPDGTAAGRGGHPDGGAKPHPALLHERNEPGLSGGFVPHLFRGYELRAGGGGHGKNGEADHQHGVSRKREPAKAA